ncbi:hypothetical protein AAH979_15340 [Plantactinospora sp. ZYX-F-223]
MPTLIWDTTCQQVPIHCCGRTSDGCRLRITLLGVVVEVGRAGDVPSGT